MQTPFPPPAAPQRRENDNFELDHFKRDIDLVRYATERHGYSVTAEGKNGQWHNLEKGGEKLLVSSGKGQEYPLYKNLYDERDAGTIIEFAQARGEGRNGPGLNLGEVRKELRTYLGEVGPEVAARPLALQFPERQPAQALPVTGSEEERREALIRQVLGAERGLTDRSYLHGRHLTNETIDNPAFQNRIFTAQDNKHHNTAFPYYNESGIAQVSSKNQEPGAAKWDRFIEGVPKEGVWVSNPTEGRGSKVDRVVISESPIDSLSYHQLNHRAGSPNTMYVATGGTPTERQAELIQKIIDRQQPREIALANDRDPSGVRYNINYLNDLGPARKMGQVGGLEAPEGASRPVEWHATTEGKYHNKIKVEFSTEKAHEGRTALAELGQRVEAINGGQNRTGEPANLKLEVLRTSSQESVARVVAPLGDTVHLLELAQYLHQQREARLLAAERQPEAFLRLEAPITKDYNQDLALTVAGKSSVEIQAFAEAQQRQYLEERLLKQQQENEARRLQDEQRRQEVEAAARERVANSPEAQRRREAEERAIGGLLAGAVAAEVRASAHENPPGPGREPEPLGTSLGARLLIREPDRAGNQEEHLPPYAAQLAKVLSEVATVTDTWRGHVTPQGLRESELEIATTRDQPGAAVLSRTLDVLATTPGVEVREYQDPASRAQFFAQQPAAEPLTLPERGEPLTQRNVVVSVYADYQPEEVRRTLNEAGAQAAPVRYHENEFPNDISFRNTHSIPLSYRLDQPELPAIQRVLTELKADGAGYVIEPPDGAARREQAAGQISNELRAYAETGRAVQLTRPDNTPESQADLRAVSQELGRMGMRVEPVEVGSTDTRLTAGYRVDQPELPRIHDKLQALGTEPGLTVTQEPAVLQERTQLLTQLAGPPQRWSERQTEAIGDAVQLQMNLLPYSKGAEPPVVGGPDWNQLTLVVERGEAAETLRQALAGAGAKTELGVANTARAIHYVDGTSTPPADYQVIHVGYPQLREGGRPAEIQQVLAETQDRGQTLLLDPHGGRHSLESLTKINEQVARGERIFDLTVQPSPAAEYRAHPNGGGLVQTTARVEESVYVGPHARVAGTAELTGHVRVEDYALVAGAARLSENVRVSQHAVVAEGAVLKGEVHVTESARVAHYATGQENAEIGGQARVGGRSLVGGRAYVGEQAEISGRAQVVDEGRVIGFGRASDDAKVQGQTQVGEPNPPRPQFERLILGEALGGAGNEQGILVRDRLTADQRTALSPSDMVPAETRQALQGQVGRAAISEDAKSWATGFYASTSHVLPPDYAGNAEKYVVLRLPTEEAAAQLKTQLLASGGGTDIHVGAIVPVNRPGQGLRPDGAENDHELRVAYHLGGRNLPAVHEAIVAAQATPGLVRSFERPLDALDRAEEVGRRPPLELEAGRARGAEAARPDVTGPLTYEQPGAATRGWLAGEGASTPPRPENGAAEKLLVLQIAEPVRADGQHPAAERVRQDVQQGSFATVGPVLPVEISGPERLAVSEVRVAYHLGQQDLPGLAQQLDKLGVQPNIFVREPTEDRDQRQQQLLHLASRELTPVSREQLEREGLTQATGLIRIAPVDGQAKPEAYAQDIRLSLEQRGATVQEQPRLNTPDSARVLEYNYALNQPGLNVLSRTLDEFSQQPGVKVQENERTQAARELHTALNPPSEAATRIPDRETGEAARPTPAAYNARGEEKLAVVQIDEVAQPAGAQVKGKAESVKENLEGAGAKVGNISSAVDERGIRHSEMLVSYRTDEPNVVAINKQLNAVPGTGGTLIEHPADTSQRLTSAANMERAVGTPAREAAPEVSR